MSFSRSTFNLKKSKKRMDEIEHEIKTLRQKVDASAKK